METSDQSLFGSAATGSGFDPTRSDLDFLVTFQDLVTESALENPYFRAREETERRPLFPAP
jgi:predicted nucleotidyltransferase